jgi:hypothetical protein
MILLLMIQRKKKLDNKKYERGFFMGLVCFMYILFIIYYRFIYYMD